MTTHHLRRLAGLAFMLASSAVGAERPSSPEMTCGEALDLVRSGGAVVLGTGLRTYERFVAHPGYCLQGEGAYGGWVPTRDVPRCAVGFVCRPGTPASEDD